ncbi:hypothetical protein M440DRAFT_1194688 [Trichoderma longibrachiatum ATCC 18648]|uniref:Uncharacterized protein n=1 Tax=Trichoderma longibrachiatum ATCC 18648 TaxID=983965 RepID=A0A2T4CA90_TRILO|nr:hypothetical protein M440DRAFT_1194688 [Trichoderma longibrachiatum ATCC 18648]
MTKAGGTIERNKQATVRDNNMSSLLLWSCCLLALQSSAFRDPSAHRFASASAAPRWVATRASFLRRTSNTYLQYLDPFLDPECCSSGYNGRTPLSRGTPLSRFAGEILNGQPLFRLFSMIPYPPSRPERSTEFVRLQRGKPMDPAPSYASRSSRNSSGGALFDLRPQRLSAYMRFGSIQKVSGKRIVPQLSNSCRNSSYRVPATQ